MITDALLLRNATMHLGGITLGPHDSNRFVIGVYQEKPVDLRTILKDTDPVDCVYAFIIVNEELHIPIWLYRESDGTFRPHGTYQQYQHNSSYVVGIGTFTYIDDFRAVSITLARDKYTIAAE